MPSYGWNNFAFVLNLLPNANQYQNLMEENGRLRKQVMGLKREHNSDAVRDSLIDSFIG